MRAPSLKLGREMHVTIEAATTGGLLLLPELDVHRLGRLEGYNGIGKSAAIRLLQVATGDQPYPAEEESLWRSFRAGVGSAKITLTGLIGADEIIWHLDPNAWPKSNDEPLDSVGRILVDGHERDLNVVRAMLRVHRIVGSEGLEPTLARELVPFRRTMTRSLGADGRILTRLDELDALFHAVEDVAAAAALPRAQAIEQEQAAAAAERAARSALDVAARTAADIAKAQTVARQLNDVRGRSGDLDAEAARLGEQIAANEASLADLENRIAAAAQQAGAKAQAKRELTNAQRHATRIARRVQDATVAVLTAADNLDLPAAELVTIDVGALITTADAMLERLHRELTTLHTAPRLVGLAEQMIDTLRVAESEGLGNEAVFNVRDGSELWTVAELRSGLEIRAALLREMPKPERADELDEQIACHRARRAALGDLQQLQAALVAANAAETKAEERVHKAAAAVGSTGETTLGNLSAQRQDRIREIRQLAIAKAETVRAREGLGGGFTEQDLASRFDDLVRRLGVEPDQLTDAARDAELARDQARQAHDDALAERRRAAAAVKTIDEQVSAAARVIHDDPSLAWVRQASGFDLPPASADHRVWLAFLEQLAATVEHLRSRIDAARQRAREIGGAFGAVERELLTGSVDHSAWTARVRDWFGGHVSAWFQQPQLVETLFPGGTDVRVDLADKSVQWYVGEEVITRPLNAFSSGERAFAYTRARLGILESDRAVPNQLIALDEFGAFMARGWLHRLEEYLRQYVEGNTGDRVLLILPLSVTEEDLAQQGGVSIDQLDQLRRRGYTIENLGGT